MPPTPCAPVLTSSLFHPQPRSEPHNNCNLLYVIHSIPPSKFIIRDFKRSCSFAHSSASPLLSFSPRLGRNRRLPRERNHGTRNDCKFSGQCGNVFTVRGNCCFKNKKTFCFFFSSFFLSFFSERANVNGNNARSSTQTPSEHLPLFFGNKVSRFPQWNSSMGTYLGAGANSNRVIATGH